MVNIQILRRNYLQIIYPSIQAIKKENKQSVFREMNQEEILNSPKKEEIKKKKLNNYVKNKGNEVGRSKTNQHGLPYEQLTNLSSHYQVVSEHPHCQQISFKGTPLVSTKKTSLFKYMDIHMNHQIAKAHGCKQPDECFINENSLTMFIIEKKFQQTGGSVCEKIQTSDFKLWQYSRTFPKYQIVYIYCLSDWFRENCIAELEYLNSKQIPVFWGNDTQYKTKIIDFMINYK